MTYLIDVHDERFPRGFHTVLHDSCPSHAIVMQAHDSYALCMTRACRILEMVGGPITDCHAGAVHPVNLRTCARTWGVLLVGVTYGKVTA